MAKRNGYLPVWLVVNAWREILTRIFENIETQFNVSPEWLVNPVTHRRLKLDIFYPEIGVAVRFEGLKNKQRKQRPSLEEEMQQKIRKEARFEMCRAHGIDLIVIDTTADTLKHPFRDIELALSRAKDRAVDETTAQKISQARATTASLTHRIRHAADFKLFAELWQDRQYKISQPAAPVSDSLPASASRFSAGMSVEHPKFGPGVIVEVAPNNNDFLLTIDFQDYGQKILLTSLVADKLTVR